MAGAQGRTVSFADGTTLAVGTVVWATGYHFDYSWIAIPGVVRDGTVIHRRGATEVPGLYFLGLSWQHTRGSALLGFVRDDAAYLASRITTASAAQPTRQPGSVSRLARHAETEEETNCAAWLHQPSATAFQLAQPTISHHLKVLREAGTIDSERRGTWVYYWLVPAALERRPRSSQHQTGSQPASAGEVGSVGAAHLLERGLAGLTARIMAECMPGAASVVKVTDAPVNPAAVSPSRYSLRDRAPAMHPT